MIDPCVFPTCTLYSKVRLRGKLVAERYPIFEPLVLWLGISSRLTLQKFRPIFTKNIAAAGRLSGEARFLEGLSGAGAASDPNEIDSGK